MTQIGSPDARPQDLKTISDEELKAEVARRAEAKQAKEKAEAKAVVLTLKITKGSL
jgi:hypothetical protein